MYESDTPGRVPRIKCILPAQQDSTDGGSSSRFHSHLQCLDFSGSGFKLNGRCTLQVLSGFNLIVILFYDCSKDARL